MSDNIFKELCNRVLSLFKQTESKEENAKDVACNRLRVVLMQDRTNLTPELLQRMRRELVELLSKYVEMDKDALELNIDQEDGQMALMLSIPVIRAKDEAEIEEALKAEDEKAASEDSEEAENSDGANEEDDSDSEVEISEDDENKAEDEAAEEGEADTEISQEDENTQVDEANTDADTEINSESLENNEKSD